MVSGNNSAVCKKQIACLACALGVISKVLLNASYVENRDSAVAVNVAEFLLNLVKLNELNTSLLNQSSVVDCNIAVAVYVADDAYCLNRSVVDSDCELRL